VLLFSEADGSVATISPEGGVKPSARGWGGAAASSAGVVIYGGLAGTDAKPVRLDDVWLFSKVAA